ncbi:CocE/NonD family hydrolase [Actinomadura verrucosospora]|uniref:X-Pro dipeptidyl-peptidase domain-containing protein n=1 Tax=Actinomadura verrucosospora TaxID=46165 RepID=A0A7D4A6Z1_ACTVE|nr:CocE/NonD family hydrolase [Actinomadura verrucosospora]QKG26684.1 X-Pro dipeptidyl-peptidase domain-containing protein [Actinomadura verrucosospora]
MALRDRLPGPPIRVRRPRGLPRAPLPRYTVERDLPVTMPDGVTLLADRYVPVGVPRPPTILVRTPYGRRGPAALANGLPFVPFGFQLVVQSARGTFGSGGEFDPLGSERDDGLATVAWLKEQPWFGGTFATYGASYLGYSAWAIAAEAGPELKAMSLQITASSFRDAAYVGGSFALESTLTWTDLTHRQQQPLGLLTATLLSRRRAVRAARSGLPLGELDVATGGEQMRFYQDLLTNHGTDAGYWDGRDFSGTVGQVEAPVTLLGGWYDVFLPWELKDYLALRAAGHRPYLTIGPWWHTDARHGLVSFRETLAWFRAHLRGDPSGLRAEPVRLYVTGAREWRHYRDWPPPGTRQERWHLHPGGGLGTDGPRPSSPSAYRFDPARPTPALGGPTLLGSSRPVDNRPLERRPDVLVFTSPPLAEPLDVIGPIGADLFVRSDREHTDFVVRLCDVAPDGTSRNVCEGGLRLPAFAEKPVGTSGVRRIAVDLWPAGHRFARGHRVRVHVASGAHPKVAANPGTGEPLATARRMVPADQEVFHDPDHPSAIVLPIAAASPEAVTPAPAEDPA